MLSKLVALALLVEIEVHIFLAQIWVVAAVPHATVWIALLASVASEVFYGLVLNKHGLPSELLINWHGTSEPLTLLVVENAIILRLCDLLMGSHWGTLLLTHEADVHFMLDLPRLVSWHELLRMLIRVRKLTCAVIVQVPVGAPFEVTASVVMLDGRLCLVGVVVEEGFARGAHAGVHQRVLGLLFR